MRSFVAVLVLAFAGIPGAVASDVPVARGAVVAPVPERPIERALASLHAESRALYELVQVLKAESRGGRLDLSDEAKLSWQRGVRAFDDVEGHVRVGDAKTALLGAAPARAAVSRGAAEAFSVRTSDPVRLAVKNYIDAVFPRLDATRDTLRLFRRTDLEPRWWEARTRFEQARELAAADRSGRAWDAIVVTAGLLDQLVLEAAFGVSSQPTAP